ncbi:MAG TPA: hypothetical protein PLO35_06925 [Candidatus Cloacimonadota bacterium]|nr:hypothetical protein [Candidatus Cloacimonadota bacterium]
MKDELVEKTREQVTQDIKYRDGIPRIAAGVFMVIAMLLALAGNTSTFVIFIPIIPGLVEGLRKRYTYPRVGYAKIKEGQSSKRLLILIALALVIGLLVFLISNGMLGFELPSKVNIYGPMALGVAMPLVLIALLLTARRRQQWPFTLITILVFLPVLLFVRLGRHTVFYIVLAFGVLNLIMGIIELRRFIKDYPVIPDD